MHYISTTEARAAFSDIIGWAQKEPVIIQRQQKDVAVLISPEEYEKLRGIKMAELDALCRRASAYAKECGLTEHALNSLLDDES